MFAKSTSVANPIIYYFLIERFRKEVGETVLDKVCCRKRKDVGQPESDAAMICSTTGVNSMEYYSTGQYGTRDVIQTTAM